MEICVFGIPILIIILLIYLHFHREASKELDEGFKDTVKMIANSTRTPLGMMALADWNDPDDPFTVALDLGIDPMTGEPFDGDVPEEPFFDPGEDF